MNVVHLTSSTFLGGPERQMLGLATALAATHRSIFLSFSEGGRCRSFLAAARQSGFDALPLQNDTPRFRAAVRELATQLNRLGADVLCCHGYKANLLGRAAARRVGIPVVAVVRGWTGENFRVRCYETLDRLHLRWMDRIVCVSKAQAEKARRAGAPAEYTTVIANAVDPERFGDPDPNVRAKLARLFRRPPARIVGAAGRLSPEKGFHVLVDAVARLATGDGAIGVVLFGEGPCRAELVQRITQAGLNGTIALVGHRADLDRFLPALDLFVLPSLTEGMPNVVLESFAAGTPVVATAAGGTPELVEEGVTGFLATPDDAESLADKIAAALAAGDQLADVRLAARQRVVEQFSFAAQAGRYRALFTELVSDTFDAESQVELGDETVPPEPERTAAPCEANCELNEEKCVTQL